MYIEVGLNLSVRERSIVGVFDLDTVSYSARTREFLKRAEQNGEVIEATDALPKSFVLTQEYTMQRIYLTKQNARVLQTRLSEERTKPPL